MILIIGINIGSIRNHRNPRLLNCRINMSIPCLVIFRFCPHILMSIDEFHIPCIGSDIEGILIFLDNNSCFFLALSTLEIVHFAAFKFCRCRSIGFIGPCCTVLHIQTQLSFISFFILFLGVIINSQTFPSGILCSQPKEYLTLSLWFISMCSAINDTDIPFYHDLLCSRFSRIIIIIEMYDSTFCYQCIMFIIFIFLNIHLSAAFNRDSRTSAISYDTGSFDFQIHVSVNSNLTAFLDTIYRTCIQTGSRVMCKRPTQPRLSILYPPCITISFNSHIAVDIQFGFSCHISSQCIFFTFGLYSNISGNICYIGNTLIVIT